MSLRAISSDDVDCETSGGTQWYHYAVQLSGTPQRSTLGRHIKVDRMRLIWLCGCHCKLCYSDDTVLYLSIMSHVKYLPIFKKCPDNYHILRCTP